MSRARSSVRAGPEPAAPLAHRSPQLTQYLVPCPACGGPSALHVDQRAGVVVRFVCPSSCPPDERAVRAMVLPDAVSSSA